MSYAMADLSIFQKRRQKTADEKSVVSLVSETSRIYEISTRLVTLAFKHRQRAEADARARIAVLEIVRVLDQTEEAKTEEKTQGKSLVRRTIEKVFKTVGRKLFENIVKPIFRFAIRMAMNVVRTTLTAVLEYVLVPAAEFIVGFALANPITAGIFAALLVTGGGYWIWKKFFSEDATKPELAKPEIAQTAALTSAGSASAAVDTSDVAVTDQDQTLAQSVETGPTLTNIIEKPLQFVKSKLAPSKSTKFTGFGDDVDRYIKESSKLSSVPEDVLRGFVKMEAGWTGAMSPTGAIGTGQFIQPTWDALAATPDGIAIGMTKIGARFRTPQDPRFNKRINTLATGLLAAQNARLLAKYGIPLTGENLYMLHNVGPGIIQVMLGRPASAAVLKAMQQNGMLSGQTAQQFLIMQKQKFNAQYMLANSSTTMNTANKTQYADGVIVPKKTENAEAAQAAAQGANNQQASNASSSDRQIIRGKGKTLIEVS